MYYCNCKVNELFDYNENIRPVIEEYLNDFMLNEAEEQANAKRY